MASLLGKEQFLAIKVSLKEMEIKQGLQTKINVPRCTKCAEARLPLFKWKCTVSTQNRGNKIRSKH